MAVCAKSSAAPIASITELASSSSETHALPVLAAIPARFKSHNIDSPSILIFFVTWKLLTDMYGGMPNRAEVAEHILGSGSFWTEVILAMVIPLLIILKDFGKSPVLFFWASLSGMVGVFFMRYNLVHDTQLKPLQMMKIREYQLAPEWIHYFPSSTEIMISLGGLGLCMLLYYVGTKLFNLDEDH